MPKQLFGKRGIDLLTDAAKCFDEGTSPFNDDFLNSHSVNLGECIALSERIGTILRGFARANFNQQAMIILLGASDELTPEAVESALDHQRADDVLKRLKALNIG